VKKDAFEQLAAVEDRHWWYRGMRATAKQILGDEPLGDVLDAGCGTGGWGAFLDQARPFGCDRHPFALQLAAPRLNGRVVRASVAALPFAGASFDTVTSIDVLYHRAVESDAVALREMARVVRPGGRVLVQVPAYDWLRGRHDAEVQTRERYTAAELRRRLQAAGLTVVRATYANAALLPFAVAWRWFERILPPGGAKDLDVPPDVANDAALAILGLEQRLLATRDLPAGLSVVAVARRPDEPSNSSRRRTPLVAQEKQLG
jgi:SAM-dependent methyltransferase